MNIRNPRILIIGLNYAPEPTGNAPYTTNLAENLTKLNFDVQVICTHPHYPGWNVHAGYGRWESRETIGGVHLRRLLHYVPSSPSSFRRLLSEMSFGARLLFSRWGRPDAIIFVSPALISTAMGMWKLRLGRKATPSVIWVQDLYSLGIKETNAGGSISAKLMSLIESSTLRSADRIVAIHDRFKLYMQRELGVQGPRVDVIRNWTHLSESAPTDRAAWRHRLGWRVDEAIVLHAGNQGAKQGLENVVEAAKYAQERGLPIRFVLLGDGNQRSKLEAAGINVGCLQFIDPLPGDEYQHAMAASDFLLVNEKPGVTEMAVPSKLTSYFSTGLPVIAATDEGSVTADEIAASGGGVRVNAGDPRALVETVLALAADPARGREMGLAGLHYRESVLGQAVAIAKFSETLKSLLMDTKGKNERNS